MNKNEITIAFIAAILCAALLLVGIIGINISQMGNIQIPELPILTSSATHSILSWLSQGDTGLKITIVSLAGLLILSVSALLIILFISLRKIKALTDTKNCYRQLCVDFSELIAENMKKNLLCKQSEPKSKKI